MNKRLKYFFVLAAIGSLFFICTSLWSKQVRTISIEIPQEAAGNKEVESKLDEKLKTYKTDWVFEKYKYREK
jgi:hypothetical protein